MEPIILSTMTKLTEKSPFNCENMTRKSWIFCFAKEKRVFFLLKNKSGLISDWYCSRLVLVQGVRSKMRQKKLCYEKNAITCNSDAFVTILAPIESLRSGRSNTSISIFNEKSLRNRELQPLEIDAHFCHFWFRPKNNWTSKKHEGKKSKSCNFRLQQPILMIFALFRSPWGGYSGGKFLVKNPMDFPRFVHFSNPRKSCGWDYVGLWKMVEVERFALASNGYILRFRQVFSSQVVSFEPSRSELSRDVKINEKTHLNRKLDLLFFWRILDRTPCSWCLVIDVIDAIVIQCDWCDRCEMWHVIDVIDVIDMMHVIYLMDVIWCGWCELMWLVWLTYLMTLLYFTWGGKKMVMWLWQKKNR